MTGWFGTLFTGPAWTGLLVLAGLLAAVGVVIRLLAGGAKPQSVTPLAFVVPVVLVAGGFYLSRSTDSLWILAVTLTMLALCASARSLLADLGGADRGRVPGPPMAVVVATAVLGELGALLTVRLVLVPDPADGLGAGLQGAALAVGLKTVAVPLAGVAVALAVTAVVRSGRPRLRARVGPRPDRSRHRSVLMPVAAVVAILLFAAPLAGTATAGSSLAVAGIATPEFGKLAFLAVLAYLVAQDRQRFDVASGPRLVPAPRRLLFGPGRRRTLRAALRASRYILYPLGLFMVVAVVSGLRHDFGTVVSAFAATVGVTWSATRSNVATLPDAAGGSWFARNGRQVGRTLRAYRVFLAMGAVLLLVTAVVATLLTDYVSVRGKVWADPWAYRWDTGCVVVDAGPSTPAQGWSPCQRSLAADTESGQSQLARALSAVADGGLWGRGLRDTASGAVPAGPTDFILVVIWHKLGGLVVLLTALLTILLGLALSRAGSPPRVGPRTPGPPAPATAVALFAAGFGALLVGQFLFVLAATVNVVPHSGLPVPLVSRGGQANLAVLLGVVAVLVLGRITATGRATHGSVAPRSEPVAGAPPAPAATTGWLGGAVAAALCLGIVAGVTFQPYRAWLPASGGLPAAYGEHRPPCPAREPTRESLRSLPPDPRSCSTDRFAYDRTRVEVRFRTGAGLVQRRPEGTWELFGGQALGGLVDTDLAGLVRVGTGQAGLVDLSLGRVVAGTAGTDLAGRLSPHPRAARTGGVVELTIEPGLQHHLAVAMRSAGPDGSGPLAGGAVAIEARTGHILASVTVPGEPPVAPGDAGTGGAPRSPDRSHYAQLGPDGSLDGSVRDRHCADHPRDCWRWSMTPAEPTTAVADPAAVSSLRGYVGGDPTVALPDPRVNRAIGRGYGLGSTFKVVIAATYLEQPGTSANDLIQAPNTIWLAPSVTIRNSGGGPCPQARNGQLSLARALAGSCNTAFVALARNLGWERVAAQAARFGLHVGGCADVPAWTAQPLAGSAGTCVPATSDPIAIGNNALGGQQVQGTPLGMATVLAAVANGGNVIRPGLVAAVTPPGTGRRVAGPFGPSRPALSERATRELVSALSATAVDGTAAGLQQAAGIRVWAKTGTHDVLPAPDGQFARHYLWLVGFVDSATRGPVSFAIVVEAADPRTGGQRVRQLAQSLVTAVGRL